MKNLCMRVLGLQDLGALYFLNFLSFLFRSRYPINKPERRVVGDKESHLVPLDEGLVDDVVRLPQVEQESDIQAPTLLGNLLTRKDIV